MRGKIWFLSIAITVTGVGAVATADPGYDRVARSLSRVSV